MLKLAKVVSPVDLYLQLSEKEKLFLSPRGRFINPESSPNHLYKERVYDKNKSLIGFGDIYAMPNSKNGSGFVSLAVSPNHRGEGLAKRILEKLIQKSRYDSNLDKLVYVVDKGNIPSQALARKYFKEDKSNETDSQLYFSKRLD